MVDIRSDMPSTLNLFVSTFAVLIGFKTPSREIGSRMRFQNQILYFTGRRAEFYQMSNIDQEHVSHTMSEGSI